MLLNDDNYYSFEADKEYFSVSLYKLFKQCEAKAVAKVKGEYRQSNNDAFHLEVMFIALMMGL